MSTKFCFNLLNKFINFLSFDSIKIMFGETFLDCPFNEAHRVHTARFHRHVMKCQKNYPNVPMEVCPYNASHYLVNVTLDEHLKKCSGKEYYRMCFYHEAVEAVKAANKGFVGKRPTFAPTEALAIAPVTAPATAPTHATESRSGITSESFWDYPNLDWSENPETQSESRWTVLNEEPNKTASEIEPLAVQAFQGRPPGSDISVRSNVMGIGRGRALTFMLREKLLDVKSLGHVGPSASVVSERSTERSYGFGRGCNTVLREKLSLRHEETGTQSPRALVRSINTSVSSSKFEDKVPHDVDQFASEGGVLMSPTTPQLSFGRSHRLKFLAN